MQPSRQWNRRSHSVRSHLQRSSIAPSKIDQHTKAIDATLASDQLFGPFRTQNNNYVPRAVTTPQNSAYSLDFARGSGLVLTGDPDRTPDQGSRVDTRLRLELYGKA